MKPSASSTSSFSSMSGSPLRSLRSFRRTLAALLLCTTAATGACNKRDRVSDHATGHSIPSPASPAPMNSYLPSPPAADPAAKAPDLAGAESYTDHGKNPWVVASADRLSTFAADVDTASYSIARRKLNEGQLPPTAAVRVEEFVNYFRYGFPAPQRGPFAVVAEAAPSPFTKGRHVVRVGVATRARSVSERKPMNLVFLVDTSGSMSSPDKLGLAKRALRILVDNLRDGDSVALTTYAGSTSVVLPATGVEAREQILSAIESLESGGSTAMASGIELAYREAAKNTGRGAVSRVIVLSDGDANVGPSSHDHLLQLISEHAHRGITLSTIGFGMGNYKDSTMEQLADKGDGNNFYIDSIEQARRVFQEQLGSTLEVVAKDVKLQVEFDPMLVSRYRLIGYENRDVADQDFRNDQVDAGEVGAGHQVTAMYEVELTALGKKGASSILTVRTRHEAPEAERASEPAVEQAFPMPVSALAASFAEASADFRFAFAVSAFADILRKSEDAEHWNLTEVRELAMAAGGGDGSEERRELVALIDRARSLSNP
jgi:Ca-activated chloride channel homolog